MLRICLLGGFRLDSDDPPTPTLPQPRLQGLLAYLVLHAGVHQSRQQIASLFWPDSSEKQARTNLRKLLYTLRRTLPDADHHLDLTPQSVQWRVTSENSCDVLRFEVALAAAEQTNQPAQKQRALQTAVDLYGGNLLPDHFADWVLFERERLRNLFASALAELAALAEAERKYDAALAHAERLLRHDPLQESSHRRLMELHLLNENRAAALRVYHSCATLLREELGVDPSPATEEIHGRLLRLEEMATAPAALSTGKGTLPLVGREAEWQQLRRAWQRAQSGRPQLLLIQGEAGIGKTRLAEELVDAAHHRGMIAVHTRAFAAEGAAAYAPLADLLRNASLRTALSALDDLWLTELARLLPELLTERPVLPAPAPIREAWQQRRFHEALARGLLSAGQPLLLHFDDLQWCDGETLGWLHFFLRFPLCAKLLVVGTVRSEEVDAEHPLNPVRLALQRERRGQIIDLAPLARDEVTELATAVTGKTLPDAAAAQLFAETEGSPLFVVEMTRAGVDDFGLGIGDFVLSSGDAGSSNPKSKVQNPKSPALPPKIQAVIQARLGQLSPAARQLAGMAAVIGRQFTYPLLTSISPQGEDEVVASLDELWRRRIVREQGADAYDFSHDRIREVAYAAIGPVRRRYLHRQVAEALEDLHTDKGGGGLDEVSSVLAGHYAAAGRARRAADYFLRAGDYAAGQFARREALRYYTRATELAPDSDYERLYAAHLGREELFRLLGNAAAHREALQRLQTTLTAWQGAGLDGKRLARHAAELSRRRQSFESQAGNHEAGQACGQRAVQLAEATGDPALEARCYVAWGDSLWITSDFEAARPKFERALAKARVAASSSLQARALELLAQTGMFSGMSAGQITEQLSESLRHYELDGDLAGRSRVLNKLGYLPMAQGEGDYEQALDFYQQGLTLCRQIGEKVLESTIVRNLSLLFCCMGRYAEALAHADEAVAVAARAENTFHAAIAENYVGYLHFQRGNHALAQSTQTTALHRLREMENHHWAAKALTNLSQIHHVLGNLDAALDYAGQACQLSVELRERRQESYACTSLGHTLLALDRADEAIEPFENALQLQRELQLYNRALEPLAGLAEIALRRDDLPTACRHVDSILHHLQTHRLDLTDEALAVYLTCHRVLAAADDLRAEHALQLAHKQLQLRAATLPNEEMRRQFWAALLHTPLRL